MVLVLQLSGLQLRAPADRLQALLLFLTTPQTAGGLGGAIPAAYASTPLFTDTPGDGAAVTVRNATYPLPNIGALITVVQTLTAAN